MPNQEYWDELQKVFDAMSDEEFMEAIEKAEMERCVDPKNIKEANNG